MPSAFVSLIIFGGLVFLVVKTVSLRRDWLDRMTHLGATRGWRVSGSLLKMPRADGEAEGCRVEVFMPWRAPDRHDRQPSLAEQLVRRRGDDAWNYTRLRITLPRELGLSFGPEAGRIGRLLKGADLELGDASFDETVRISGSETVLRARLDAPTRWAVRLLVERGGACDGRTVDLAWQHDRSAGRDAAAIDCALDAVRRLREEGGTTRERLAAIAGGDPKPGVRLGALRCLVERHRTATETAGAVQAGLTDDDPAVRLVAAVQTGAVAVLEGLLPPGHPMAVRVGAVEALAAHDAGLAILRRVITRLDGEAKAAAIAALKASGGVAVGGLALAEAEGGELALAEPTEG